MCEKSAYLAAHMGLDGKILYICSDCFALTLEDETNDGIKEDDE